MNLKEIVEQLKLCNFECEGGHIQNNIAFMELEKLAESQEDSCIYTGLADLSFPTVKTAISCYLGKKIAVSIVGCDDD